MITIHTLIEFDIISNFYGMKERGEVNFVYMLDLNVNDIVILYHLLVLSYFSYWSQIYSNTCLQV